MLPHLVPYLFPSTLSAAYSSFILYFNIFLMSIGIPSQITLLTIFIHSVMNIWQPTPDLYYFHISLVLVLSLKLFSMCQKYILLHKHNFMLVKTNVEIVSTRYNSTLFHKSLIVECLSTWAKLATTTKGSTLFCPLVK